MLEAALQPTAFAPQMDHPYLRRFDLIHDETGKYIGALVEFELQTWKDVHSGTRPEIKLHLYGNPKDKNGSRTLVLRMEPRRANVNMGGPNLDIARMGAKISQVDFDILCQTGWAFAYHRDPLDYEVGQWKRGLKKPLD